MNKVIFFVLSVCFWVSFVFSSSSSAYEGFDGLSSPVQLSNEVLALFDGLASVGVEVEGYTSDEDRAKEDFMIDETQEHFVVDEGESTPVRFSDSVEIHVLYINESGKKITIKINDEFKFKMYSGLGKKNRWTGITVTVGAEKELESANTNGDYSVLNKLEEGKEFIKKHAKLLTIKPDGRTLRTIYEVKAPGSGVVLDVPPVEGVIAEKVGKYIVLEKKKIGDTYYIKKAFMIWRAVPDSVD